MKAIIELQKRAMDSSTDIVELVRYAYAIAYKLELQDFVHWCNAELEGYLDNDSVPEYRCIRGEIVAIFANGDQKPIDYKDPISSDYMQQKSLRDSLDVLKSYHSEKDIVRIGLNDERKRRVLDFCERDYKDYMSKALSGVKPEDNPYNIKEMRINSMPSLTPYLFVNNSEIIKIFDVVRKKILDWVLDCQKQGILEEELEFTKEEKEVAKNITYHIGSVQNMANHNTESTINQTAQNMSVTKGDLQSLVNFLSDKGISEPDIQEFKEIIEIEPNITVDGIQNSKIQQWVGKIAIGGRLVAKGVAIDVIVEAIKQFF